MRRGAALCALAWLAAACGSDDSGAPASLPPAPTQGAAGTIGQPPVTGGPAAGGQAPVIPITAGRGAGPVAGQTANGSAGRGPAGGTAAPNMNPAGTGVAGTAVAGMGAAGMLPVAGTPAAGTGAVPPAVECKTSAAPAQFEPNPSVGGGGSPFTDSAHFRIVGVTGAAADGAIKALEGAYDCFVETLCWRSSGLSYNTDGDQGPYYKMNIYSVGSLGSAAGQMFSDARSGLSYLKVVTSYLADPKVSVHEYGHALTYHEKGWVDQTRTGAWWETVANFVADTFMTSPLCEEPRKKSGAPGGNTIIDLNKVLGDSQQVIVDGSQGSGNYYQAWPFLTYLTNNPDNYPGLGRTALRDMFRNHKRNNETPLHVLERVAMPTKVQTIVGRYWARMAYLDIGHKQAQDLFFKNRSRINFANLDAMGQTYRVKANRQPKYLGANIIPLTGSGAITVKVTSADPFTATLAIRAMSGAVRYVDLANGSGEATLAAGEEASLVVVNTPAMLYLYDPFSITGDVARGLNYDVQFTGAMPAN
ncbi:MAG TPA: DUF6055 domain-containing protein [Polyangiales bacterium]|nr:DUF6055 domain-containing protein [Polyangiales bacterium]